MVLLVGVTAFIAGGCGGRRIEPNMGGGPVDLALGTPLVAKTPKPLDLSFIPADAVFAMVLDPFQLTESPQFPAITTTGLKELISNDLGVDMNATEQVVVIGGVGKKLGEFFVGTILRYKQPFDQQQFLNQRASEWEEASEGERKYNRPRDTGAASVFFADNKTVVVAEEATLKKMLAAKPDAESKLLSSLRKADDSAAALAILDMAAVRPQVMAFLLFSKLPPPFDAPPFDGVKEVPKNVDEAVVKFVVIPTTGLTAVLHAKDQEAAVATDALIGNLLEKVGDLVNDMTEVSEDADRSTAQAAAGMQALFGTLQTEIKHKHEGSDVNISFEGLTLQNQLIMLASPVLNPLRQSWENSIAARSRDNMKKIGAALLDVAAAKGSFPAPANYAPDGKPLLSWRVHLLPQLGLQSLYEQFHLDEPWDSEHNKKLIVRMPMIYRTPGHVFDGKTFYVLPIGTGALFEGNDGAKPDSISDGKDKTILAVELYEGRGVEWTKPEDLKYDRADPTTSLIHLAKPEFNAIFVDGEVRAIDGKRYNKILTGLFTPASGDEVPEGL